MSDRLQFAGKIVLGVVLMGAAYCAGCGRVDAWPGWCFSGFFLMMLTASDLVLVRVAPDLVVERVSWPADAMRWDKQIVSWLAIAPIVTCLVAGLDARRNGVPVVNSRVLIGYGVAVVAASLIHTAMAVNRFYAPTVRIQVEREHKLVDAGPYRLVRHPGNLGNILLNLATPLMLASRWAWVPVALSALLTIIRTMLEDHMLSVQLTGYQAFSQQTRSRLLPGVW